VTEGPRRTGRPTKPPPPGKRASLGLKVTAEIKQKIEAAAQANGRTQSQEAESRLERSFAIEDERRAFMEGLQQILVDLIK
jgi:hypothetical protein